MWLNLSELPPEKKMFAWQWIKDNKPEYVDLLAQDDVKDAQKVFNASMSIPLEPSEIADMRKKFALVKQESV